MEPIQPDATRTEQLRRDQEIEEHLAGIPASAKFRSVAANKFEDFVVRYYPQCLPKFRERHPGRFTIFQDAPARQAALRLLDAACLAAPSLPPSEAMRRMGHLVYPDLLQSAWGRIVFGILGSDIEAIIRLGPRGYKFMEGSQVEYTHLGEGHFRYDFDQCYLWLDSFQVGIIEGAANLANKKTEINVSLKSRYSGSLEYRLF